MKLSEALPIAEAVVELLRPECTRIEIAGSIRRQKPEVGDIEIVATPRLIEFPDSLFDVKMVRTVEFIQIVNSWEKIKGDPIDGKYCQRVLPEGINLDLFMATPENWGFIYAIRTGSADFLKNILANTWWQKGYRGVDGNLTKITSGQIIPIREEIDLFNLLGLKYVEPKDRELQYER